MTKRRPRKENLSLRLWLHLMKCTKTIETNIGGQFRRFHRQGLSRYDVLSQLYRFESKWGSIGEVADQLMAAGRNITGLIDRMEVDGLVERRLNPIDRRSFQMRITEEGKRIFLNMTDDHENWIEKALSDIPSKDKEKLIELLVRVRRAFEAC